MNPNTQAAATTTAPQHSCVVVDTNIVLDLFVFGDAAAMPLRDKLVGKTLQWLATQAMRDELERVLAYPQIVPRLAFYKRTADAVLQDFDACVRLVDVAPKATVSCKDADDQKFIDLAISHKALLLSKDKAVLCMARRLKALGASVFTSLE